MQEKLSRLFMVIALVLFCVSGYIWVTKDKGNVSWNETNVALTETDFGDVKDTLPSVKGDTLITRKYTIRNTGIDTLRILFVSPDCNCTGYTLSVPYAVPGDSMELGLEVDMSKKHIGRYMLNTVVGINTEKRLYRIRMEGEVLP